MLSALALLLGYVESFVPIPIPGVKLGLANIPVLVCLADGDLWGAFFVGMVKVAATSLLFGNPVTLAYSLVGTVLAFVCMAPLSKLPTMRVEMVSVVGALAHEAGQLLVAQMLLGTSLVWYSAPLLGVAGCVTGALCGAVALRVQRILASGAQAAEACDDDQRLQARKEADVAQSESLTRPLVLLLGYVGFVIVVMHSRTLPILGLCLAIALASCGVSHIGGRTIGTALAPTIPIALVTMVAQVASNQQGNVLAQIGPVTLTIEAVAAVAVMVARLASVSLVSVAFVRLATPEGLASCLSRASERLASWGVSTQGPELALATTFQLIPLLAERIDGSVGSRRPLFSRAFWTVDLPELAAELYHQAEDLR